ncbi:MAG: hypothetical protein HY293_09865, partial [Planctomycetes bacterium]|nr:hypothetical protein [Planctomycetota bacterium]
MKNLALATLLVLAPQAGRDAGVFESPLKAEDLDPAAFVEWVDGAERPAEAKNGPKHVLWTSSSAVEWNGLKFGDSNKTGPRHLKIGFKQPVELAGVGVRGGGALSVLKPGAEGKLDDESQ